MSSATHTRSAKRPPATDSGGRGRWWMVPGAITLLLLAYNSPLVRWADLPRALRLKRRMLSLHMEMNLAVWWSAILYLLAALIFYEVACREGRPRRRAYLFLSLLMLGLVMDEVGSFHEWVSGLGGWAALAPFGLAGALLLADALRLLGRDRETRPVMMLALIGFAVFGTVALQEYAEHNLVSREWRVRYGRFLEEATELVGAWFLLAGAVYARWGLRWGAPASAVVPDPTRLARLVPAVLVGFLVHLVLSQFVFVRVGEWDGRPSAIYPTVLFFVLACYAFWVPRQRAAESVQTPELRGFWSAAALFFLACSIGSMQNLWGLFGYVIPGMSRTMFYEEVPIWTGMLVVAGAIGLVLRHRRDRRLLWLLLLPLAMWIQVDLQHGARKHLAGGLFAALCALALLRPDGWAKGRGPIESAPAEPTRDLET